MYTWMGVVGFRLLFVEARRNEQLLLCNIPRGIKVSQFLLRILINVLTSAFWC